MSVSAEARVDLAGVVPDRRRQRAAALALVPDGAHAVLDVGGLPVEPEVIRVTRSTPSAFMCESWPTQGTRAVGTTRFGQVSAAARGAALVTGVDVAEASGLLDEVRAGGSMSLLVSGDVMATRRWGTPLSVPVNTTPGHEVRR